MNLSLRALAWFFCIISLTFQCSFASQYIPWHEKDYSSFKSDNDQQVTLRIDSTSSIWRHVTDFAGFGPTWLYSGAQSEELMLYSPDTITFQSLINFDSALETRQSIEILPCNVGDIIIAEKDASLTVTAGTFNQVIRLDLETSCSDAGITHIWFAKNVGIIQWTELNIAGDVTYQLQEASIDGKLIHMAENISITYQFPESKIWINPIPPLPNEIPTATLGLEIVNHLNHDLNYHFGSSQLIDIIVRNELGELVTQWSRDKMFLTVVNDVVISTGETLRVTEMIELIDESGEVLAPGKYEFEILLAVDRGPKGSQWIEIDHAQ